MLFTGIDLIEIERIKKSAKSERFLMRVFSQKEREYFELRAMSAETIAANFAAKEAFGKSLGTGIRGFALCEVSALRDKLGRPYLELSGKARDIARLRGLQFSVSMSHTKSHAVAMVVAWSSDRGEEE